MGDTPLEQSLRELNTLLASVGETFWAQWAARAADRIAAGGDPGDVRGVFGGMGSFNDLVIHPANGHSVTDDRIVDANRHLDELRERIYAESQAV
ncbi:hypothetical protein QE374_000437 [Microbacterium sp. SORGH_AS428]|uniref:DUF6966 domain-containing protein n=1 Tax=Microbacterium sp. SORGH_AS_0428 TaxID=3041788 RepID=UPI00285AB33D|nr:hypothetical protein [Microbacterium sp. SORGH_AS_0428]MDR6198528.1 hypothetical protein [Microbacterium sp. SORGH_AS_0428]